MASASKGTNTAQFLYDGLGRCVKRTINGVTRRIAYDDWNPIVEWDQTGNTKAWMLYGATVDEILIRWDATHGALFYKRDRQGSVTFLLNGSNQIVERYRYDVFGKPTILSPSNAKLPTSAYGNRFMYTGREWIPELGIYDYRNRFYHPELGRFLQTDPTGFDGGDMNLFRYVADDPVDGTDPMGLRGQFGPIQADWWWRSACFFDGGNSFQGNWNEFMNRYQGRRSGRRGRRCKIDVARERRGEGRRNHD